MSKRNGEVNGKEKNEKERRKARNGSAVKGKESYGLWGKHFSREGLEGRDKE